MLFLELADESLCDCFLRSSSRPAYSKRLLSGSPVTMVFSGDSTTAGGEFETYIPIMARDNGIRGISVYNRGYSGQTLQWWLANRMGVDLNETPGYGAAHALFHRWGINDPASGRTLAQIADDLWTGLRIIRQNRPVSQLTIFLCMPNASVLDPQRTEAWFEGLYRIYRNAARKFQCVFVDVYGYMRDNRTTSDWADSIDNGDGDIGHIHPDSFGRAQIRNLYADVLFPRGLVSTIGVNRFWNVSGAEVSYTQPLVTSPPSFFPYGETNGRPSGAGWPIDGKLTTSRQVDGTVHQQITSYYEPYMVKYERTNTATGPSLNREADWTGWVNTVGPAPTVNIEYANGWTTFFADYGPARCTKDASGRVLIEGVIANGLIAPNTLIGILPVGFRPSKRHIYSQPTDVGGRATIQVFENGQIWGTNGLNASWTSLDGIMFTAAF